MLRIVAFIVCVFALYYSVSSDSTAQEHHDIQPIAAQAAMPGNVDKVFMQGMLVHHQSAIDMANVEVKYGQDPEAKKLAAQIIAEQTGEMKSMRDWLAKPGQ